MQKLRNAFTIMELIIVVILLGVVAAFGIPNYTRTREKAIEQGMVSNLRIIAAAMETYRLRNGGYPTVSMVDVNDVNTALNINIIASNTTYSCTEVAVSYACGSFGGNPPFLIWIADTYEGNPRCTGPATCPSCPGPPCWY